MTHPLYLYAVARARQARPDQPRPAVAALAPFPVQTISYCDVLGICCQLAPDGGGLRDLALLQADPRWIRARLLEAQQLHTALGDHYVLLPSVFGTVLEDAASVHRLLAAQYDGLKALLDQVVGAVEWGVKIFCDRALLLAWLAAQTPAHANAAHAARLADTYCAQHVEECHAQLTAYARAAHSYPPAPASDGQVPMFNAIYLVDEAQQSAFDTALAALEQGYAARGLRFEITGPWPPALGALVVAKTTDALLVSDE